MRPTREVTNVLYVDQNGLVHSGRLVFEPQREGEEGPILMSRTGRALRPMDVLAVLEARPGTEAHGAALCRAVQAGYRVEAM